MLQNPSGLVTTSLPLCWIP